MFYLLFNVKILKGIEARRKNLIAIVFAVFFLFIVLVTGLFAGDEKPGGNRLSYIPKVDNKEDPEELFEKALLAKDLSEKERLYLRVLEYWPSYAPAHNNLGDVYEKQGRFKEAIKEYEIASGLAPGAPYPYFGLGDVYFKLGKFEKAIFYYKKGLAIEPKDEIARKNLKLAKILTEKIFFAFDSWKLTNKAKKILKRMAEAMQAPELKNARFEIQGHTDSTGPEDYNLRLSIKRAKAVKRFLVKECGIEEKRLIVKGYGEDRPIASNDTKEGRQKNRRVEVKIENKPV